MPSHTVGYYLAENTSGFNTPVIKAQTKTHLSLETVLQDGNTLNKNGRVYPTEVIEKAAGNKYVRERLETKTWYGEANHPITKDVKRMSMVDHGRMSHIITSFRKEGDNLFVGDVETIGRSPLGETMRGVIEQGSKVGFSMRGFAQIKEETRGGRKVEMVQSPLMLVTYDWVMNPSHTSAYMRRLKETEGHPFEEEAGVSDQDVRLEVTEPEIRSFLSENSDRWGLLDELMGGLDGKPLSLSADGRTVRIRDGDDVAVLRLEDYVRKEYRRAVLGG